LLLPINADSPLVAFNPAPKFPARAARREPLPRVAKIPIYKAPEMMSKEFDISMACIQPEPMYQRKKSFLHLVNLGQYPSEVSRALGRTETLNIVIYLL
jgi:hypothetical protein